MNEIIIKTDDEQVQTLCQLLGVRTTGKLLTKEELIENLHKIIERINDNPTN